MATREAPLPPVTRERRRACLEYDERESRVLVRLGPVAQGVRVSPTQHRRVRHMLTRNDEAGGASVLCGHAELIRAVWDERAGEERRGELNRVVWDLRRRLYEITSEELIENEHGRGYRFLSCH